MKRNELGLGALVGFISSLVVMAVSYLGNAVLGLPFLPFDLFDWLTRALPGGVIEFGLRNMISIIGALHLGPTDTTAKLAEQLLGLIIVAVTGAVFGLALVWIGRWRPAWLIRAGLVGGLVLWIGMAFAELSLPQDFGARFIGVVWLLILLAGWGWQLARQVDGIIARPAPAAAEGNAPAGVSVVTTANAIPRRSFLALAGAGAVSFVVLALGIIRLRSATAAPASIPVTGGSAGPTPVPDLPYGPQYTSGPAASPSADALAKRFDPAPGTRPEITPVDKFYRIDINDFPPQVDGKSWSLKLKGMVDKPLNLTLNDIRSRPSVTQALTMECISNPVGGDLISTNYWTGVRFKDVLADAGVQPGAVAINITAADGFYESVPLQEAMDERCLLVYAMNGAPLTPEHGYPLRIYIPNHYGMKQPKWIANMEVVNQPGAGYWVDRGWSETAIPQTTSVIDTVNVDKNELALNGKMLLGGIAWAGARGISKVEVQIDGAPWVEAELRTPTVSPLTWVQWRYDWKPTSGLHTVSVRATDGAGALQTATPTDPAPEGATGIYSTQISI